MPITDMEFFHGHCFKPHFDQNLFLVLSFISSLSEEGFQTLHDEIFVYGAHDKRYEMVCIDNIKFPSVANIFWRIPIRLITAIREVDGKQPAFESAIENLKTSIQEQESVENTDTPKSLGFNVCSNREDNLQIESGIETKTTVSGDFSQENINNYGPCTTLELGTTYKELNTGKNTNSRYEHDPQLSVSDDDDDDAIPPTASPPILNDDSLSLEQRTSTSHSIRKLSEVDSENKYTAGYSAITNDCGGYSKISTTAESTMSTQDCDQLSTDCKSHHFIRFSSRQWPIYQHKFSRQHAAIFSKLKKLKILNQYRFDDIKSLLTWIFDSDLKFKAILFSQVPNSEGRKHTKLEDVKTIFNCVLRKMQCRNYSIQLCKIGEKVKEAEKLQSIDDPEKFSFHFNNLQVLKF